MKTLRKSLGHLSVDYATATESKRQRTFYIAALNWRTADVSDPSR